MVDEGSTTGKALTEWYKEHNIAIYDQQGQLLSLYEVLGKVAEIWPTLDKNEQAYYLNQQAGANQTQNLAAILSNFDHAIEATETALNSAGSAAEENAAYMEGLEAKTKQLESTFQSLSNNVADENLISGILTLSNALLTLANTGIGTVITQGTLLFGLIWGGSGLIQAMKVIPAAMSKMGSAAGVLGTAFGVTVPQIAAFSLAAGAAIGIIKLFKQQWDKAHPSLETIRTDLENVNLQIEEMTASDSEYSQLLNSSKELNEYEAIRLNYLQHQLDTLKQQSQELAKQEYETWQATQGTGSYTSLGAITDPNELLKLKEMGAISGASGGTWIAKGASDVLLRTDIAELYELNKAIEDVNTTYKNSEYSQEQYLSRLKEISSEYADSYTDIKQYISINEDAGYEVYHLSEEQKTLVSVMEDLIGVITNTEDSLNNITQSEKDLDSAFQEFNSTGRLSMNTVNSLQSVVDSLATKFGNQTVSIDGTNVALGDVSVSALTTKNAFLDLFQVIAQLQFSEAKNKFRTIADNISTAGDNAKQLETLLEARSDYMSAEQAYVEMMVNINLMRKNLAEDIGEQTTGGSTFDPLKEEYEAFKAYLEQSLHEIFLLEQNNADSQLIVQKYKEMQEAIRLQGIKFREEGLADNHEYIIALSEEWWSFEDEIKEIYNNLTEANLAAMEKQKEAYETLFSVMSNKINAEIEQLNDERAETENYWNDKIEALQKQNEEIEKQIELEKLLDELARAKQSKALVYKDGKFQYVEDVDAISEATTNLESYEREEALRDEVNNLESLKDKALQSIDDQIEAWEKYKEEWESVVSDYEEQQNLLLIEQQLGIKLEGENWRERLDNLKDYIEEYNALLSTMGSLEASSSSGNYKVHKVQADGNAPADAAVGDYVVTAGGTYQVVSPNTPGSSYNPESGKWSVKVPGYASGTLSADEGMSLVGENGPELRILGQRDGVLPSNITKNLWSWGTTNPASMLMDVTKKIGSIGQPVNISIQNFAPNLPNVTNGEDFVNYMRNNFWRKTLQFQY